MILSTYKIHVLSHVECHMEGIELVSMVPVDKSRVIRLHGVKDNNAFKIFTWGIHVTSSSSIVDDMQY